MATINCPVCGKNVPEQEAVKQEYREEQSLEKYYFCSQECRMEFINNPGKYKGQSGRHVAR